MRPMISTSRLLTALAGVSLMLAACATDQRSRSLDDTLQRYEKMVRWGEFRAATAFIHPDERPSSQRLNFLLQRFEQVRVTSYMPLSQAPGPDEDTVIQFAEIRVANRHTARERTIRDRQVWKWDAEVEQWWLMTGLPDISRR